MAQMTRDLAMESLRYCGQGERPPLTVREVEQLLHTWLGNEVIRCERDVARMRYDSAVEILTAIHSLLYPPPFGLSDGRAMVFRDPDPHQRLQHLSDLIRKIPDDLARIAKQGAQN